MKPDPPRETRPRDIKRYDAQTALGRRILAAEKAYPVDETAGQDFARREANRARLLQSNSEQARAYIGSHKLPEEELIDKEANARFRKAIRWLELKCRDDVPLRMILAASRSEKVDDMTFKSSIKLAEVCGLSVAQVKSAKDRLKYLIGKVEADTFEAFIDIISSED